jgi:hypothetical protein
VQLEFNPQTLRISVEAKFTRIASRVGEFHGVFGWQLLEAICNTNSIPILNTKYIQSARIQVQDNNAVSYDN